MPYAVVKVLDVLIALTPTLSLIRSQNSTQAVRIATGLLSSPFAHAFHALDLGDLAIHN